MSKKLTFCLVRSFVKGIISVDKGTKPKIYKRNTKRCVCVCVSAFRIIVVFLHHHPVIMNKAASPIIIDLVSPQKQSHNDTAVQHRGGTQKREAPRHVAAAAAAVVPHDVILLSENDDDDDDQQQQQQQQQQHITTNVTTTPLQRGTRNRKRQRRQGLPKEDSTQEKTNHQKRSELSVMEQQQHHHHAVIDLLNDTDTPMMLTATTTTTTTAPAAATVAAPIPSVSPELQVLEVFPDADLGNVQTLLEHFDYKTDIVLSVMSERGYTKASTKATPTTTLQQQKNQNRITNNRGITTVSAGSSTNDTTSFRTTRAKWSYDFMASDSFIPTQVYIKQAKLQLLYEFWFLTSTGVDVILKRYNHHYAQAHTAIVNVLKVRGDDGSRAPNNGQEDEIHKYHCVNMVLFQRSSLTVQQTETLNAYHPTKKKTNVVCKRPNFAKRQPPRISDPVLQEEIMYVQEKFQAFLDVGRKHDVMEMNKQNAIASQTAVECSCCYDSYDISDMVACKMEGHLFCVDCLKQFAENQIFGVGNLGIDRRTKKPSHELKCFHGECSSGFDRLTLGKALPETTLQKYDEMQFNTSLQVAGLANLVKCPKCEFQVELPYDHKFLVCPVESCQYASCRECGEPAHIGIR